MCEPVVLRYVNGKYVREPESSEARDVTPRASRWRGNLWEVRIQWTFSSIGRHRLSAINHGMTTPGRTFMRRMRMSDSAWNPQRPMVDLTLNSSPWKRESGRAVVSGLPSPTLELS